MKAHTEGLNALASAMNQCHQGQEENLELILVSSYNQKSGLVFKRNEPSLVHPSNLIVILSQDAATGCTDFYDQNKNAVFRFFLNVSSRRIVEKRPKGD